MVMIISEFLSLIVTVSFVQLQTELVVRRYLLLMVILLLLVLLLLLRVILYQILRNL
jgi:hypothetical protein